MTGLAAKTLTLQEVCDTIDAKKEGKEYDKD